MPSGCELRAGHTLYSPLGQYRLRMQPDGNVVEYTSTNRELWSTGTAGHRGALLRMQADGNLVVYASDRTTVLWSAGAQATSGGVLRIGDDANLAVYAASDGRPIWSPGVTNNELRALETLNAGWSLYTPDRTGRLMMQGDGNAVLLIQGRVRWNSGTHGNPGAQLVMQSDGNLVVYASNGATALWSAASHATGGRLVVQDDLNLVLYADAGAYWATNTHNNVLMPGQTLQPGHYLKSATQRYTLLMQGDGNLVLHDGATPVWSTGTSGSPGANATMQNDGNFVVYSVAATALWSTATSSPGSELVAQDDANLVVYGGGQARWARLASPPPPPGSKWLPLAGNDIKVGCTWSNGCSGGYHGAGAKAIDFIVPEGRSVYASAAGTITQAQGGCGPNSNGCNGSRGNYITVSHGSYSSRYLHLSSIVVASGAVAAGQLIAFSGSSGQNAVPHLHYDELTDPVNGTGKLDPGPMNACHGASRKSYPGESGAAGWPAVPYGRLLRNDGYGC